MKICIDPGHGGYDPGAVNHNVGVTEKALSLKIAALLGGELASRGYDVFFTRELDTFIPLGFRTKIANNEKADLFISIHLNAAADPAAQGIETWYYEGSRASERLAAIVQRELKDQFLAKNRGVKSTRGFYVLKHTAMPAFMYSNILRCLQYWLKPALLQMIMILHIWSIRFTKRKLRRRSQMRLMSLSARHNCATI